MGSAITQEVISIDPDAMSHVWNVSSQMSRFLIYSVKLLAALYSLLTESLSIFLDELSRESKFPQALSWAPYLV